MIADERTASINTFSPKLVSFDVFGTLVNVREGSYAAFESILNDTNGYSVDVRSFWEHWEQCNIAHYWEPYRRYRDICTSSLEETFTHFGLNGEPSLIERYFDAFSKFTLYQDVLPTFESLARSHRIGIVSNIDDDLLSRTNLPTSIDLVCTAERARGYKPDGTLFRYLIDHAGVPLTELLHAGQSQFTDMVGAKPLGLTVAWINRRGVELDSTVPKPDVILPDIASLLPLIA
jgi:2-haloacid dehalogenase